MMDNPALELAVALMATAWERSPKAVVLATDKPTSEAARSGLLLELPRGAVLETTLSTIGLRNGASVRLLWSFHPDQLRGREFDLVWWVPASHPWSLPVVESVGIILAHSGNRGYIGRRQIE